ncbi:MAG: hypothetical protein OCC49_10240 [Fibrobacterales bacterium]
MRKNIYKITAVVLAPILFFACGSSAVYKDVSLYSSNPSSELILIRPTNKVASAVSVDMYINNLLIGKLGKEAFLKFKLKPGTYNVKIGEGTKSDLFLAQSVVVEIEKGGNSCFVLNDDYIDDERGAHISLKPELLDENSCHELMRKHEEAESPGA